MKNLGYILFMVILVPTLSAQDIFFTIRAELNNESVALDSIFIENLSNNTSVLFDNLPDLENYQINMSRAEFWGSTGLDDLQEHKEFSISQNLPGNLVLSNNNNTPLETEISIYNIRGEKVYFADNSFMVNNSIKVQLGGEGIFFVKLKTLNRSQVFKAIGTPYFKKIDVTLIDQKNSIGMSKSQLIHQDDQFSFSIGDSICISVYKGTYFASPTNIIISEESKSFDFDLFEVFTDSRDNRIYKMVIIGGQTWMAENLAYLPSISLYSQSSGSASYYVYGYEGSDVNAAKLTANYKNYGVLYNWTATQAACPAGWHVPTDEEWKIMEKFIGLSETEADAEGWRGENEGTKLKAIDDLWSYGNSTNDYNFAGLPGGMRIMNGSYFNGIRQNGQWWTSSEKTSGYAYYRSLGAAYNTIFRMGMLDKRYGLSVRCVMDKKE